MTLLLEIVDYDLAKLLDNNIWSPERYAAEDLEVTWNNYLTAFKIRNFKEGELITDGDNVHGKTYFAPSYADVISYLSVYHKIYIDFIPCFTFSTNGHIAYYYKVYRKNDDEGRLDLLIEEKEWMASFKLAIKTIVEKLLENKFIKF